jgi:hypothetical protein
MAVPLSTNAVNPVILGLALARLRTLAPTAISAGSFG